MIKLILASLIASLGCGFIATTPKMKKSIREIFGCFSVGFIFTVILVLGLWL